MTGKSEGFWQRPRGIRLALLIVGSVALPLILVAFVLFMMGLAHKGFDVTYENRTAGDVTIFVDGEFWASVAANESTTFSPYKFHWDSRRLVEVRDKSGRVLFSDSLSEEDIEQMGHRIVVRER